MLRFAFWLWPMLDALFISTVLPTVFFTVLFPMLSKVLFTVLSTVLFTVLFDLEPTHHPPSSMCGSGVRQLVRLVV